MSTEKAADGAGAEGGVAEREDEHVTVCTHDFTRFLTALGLVFKRTQSGVAMAPDEFPSGEVLRTPPSSPNGEKAVAATSPAPSTPFDWIRGSAYAAYSSTGRPYIVKVSTAGSLETSLLLQAQKLHEKRSEDVCLPLLFAHSYNHPASTNLLVMEFCERGTLSYLLKSLGHVPMHRQYIARIMCGIATAVHFLHTQGIFHGAIRSSNVLVDIDMVGRLGGLSGVWNVVKGKRVKCTQIFLYRAPEADREGSLALPQDMFAIGVILYRCVTATSPKRKSTGAVDYRMVASSVHVPLDPELWRTTQLLLSDKLDLRPSSGELLHTTWIQRAKHEPIKQIFNWKAGNSRY